MIAYKLVRRNIDDTLSSAIIKGIYSVDYGPNKPTTSVTPLFAFSSVEASINYARSWDYIGLLEVWECEVVDCPIPKTICEVRVGGYPSHYDQELDAYFSGRKCDETAHFLDTTVFCKSITLLKKVFGR